MTELKTLPTKQGQSLLCQDRHASIVDGDFLDEATNIVTVAVSANHHTHRSAILPLETDEIAGVAVVEAPDLTMKSRLAESDFICIVLFLAHILAKKSTF